MDKTFQEIIDEIKTKLDLLIERDSYLLYSTSRIGHKYTKLPPLSLEEVTNLEEKIIITLPEDFKAFITQIAGGGAGPDYGIYSISQYINF